MVKGVIKSVNAILRIWNPFFNFQNVSVDFVNLCKIFFQKMFFSTQSYRETENHRDVSVKLRIALFLRVDIYLKKMNEQQKVQECDATSAS